MDPNAYRAQSIESPAYDSFRITPDDANDLDVYTSFIYIETGGDLAYKTAAGATLTVSYDRGYHPLRISKVFASGTTAAGIVGHIHQKYADANAQN